MTDVVRRRLRVRGRVQGVYFRASTQNVARRLGLTGFVRNLADGSVLVEAQGGEAAVGELHAWCGQGPTHAEVTGMTEESISVIPDEVEFEVRY